MCRSNKKEHENASTSKNCATICVYSSRRRHWISLNKWKSLQISFNRAFTKQSMQLCRERNSCRNRNRIKIKNVSTSYRQRDANEEFDRRCAQINRDKNILKRWTKRKNNCTRKENWISSNIQIFYRFVVEILTFNRLNEEQKSQIKKNI